jgi:hypothetical protein
MAEEGTTPEPAPLTDEQLAEEMVMLQHRRSLYEANRLQAQANELHWRFQLTTVEAQLRTLDLQLQERGRDREVARMLESIRSYAPTEPSYEG